MLSEDSSVGALACSVARRGRRGECGVKGREQGTGVRGDDRQLDSLSCAGGRLRQLTARRSNKDENKVPWPKVNPSLPLLSLALWVGVRRFTANCRKDAPACAVCPSDLWGFGVPVHSTRLPTTLTCHVKVIIISGK